MDEKMEVKYKISPRFNFIYELGMPTGKKIRNDLIILIAFVILSFASLLFGSRINVGENPIIESGKISNIASMVCFIATIVVAIKFIIDIVIQNMQYKHLTYTFYEEVMVYEDDFLNQHKKTVAYKNIKEVEVRRTIWDRLLNFGIIIIHTNAENGRGNGIVIYGIKDPKYHYDIIYGIIHEKNTDSNYNTNYTSSNQKMESVDNSDKKFEYDKEHKFKDEKDFSNYLKNSNK